MGKKKSYLSIIDVLRSSNMKEINLIETKTRRVVYEKPREKESEDFNIGVDKYYQTEYLDVCDCAYCNQKETESWVSSIILLFTLFDSWLEDKYHLTEGESYRKHYEELKSKACKTLDYVALNCYRILKIIRNGVQHNLGSVVFDKDGCHISYSGKHNTLFRLEMNKEAINSLYTVVMIFAEEQIRGIDSFMTEGHYRGIINWHYNNVYRGITVLEDEFRDANGNVEKLENIKGLMLTPVLRCLVLNPKKPSIQMIRGLKLEDVGDDYLYFIRPDGHKDTFEGLDYYVEDGNRYYLLPEEIGRVVSCREEADTSCYYLVVLLPRSAMKDEWKLNESLSFILTQYEACK